MRRDELSLAWPLMSIVEGRSAEVRQAEANAWIAARSRRGVVAVRCALGTITGLFFFVVEATHGCDCLLADRLILVDLFGAHRTLAAILRATRELGEIHACRKIRVLPPDDQTSPAAEGVVEVVRRLGFTCCGRAWYLDLEPYCARELLAQRQEGAAHGETRDDVDAGSLAGSAADRSRRTGAPSAAARPVPRPATRWRRRQHCRRHEHRGGLGPIERCSRLQLDHA